MPVKRKRRKLDTSRKVKGYDDRVGYGYASAARYLWRNNPPFVRLMHVRAMQKDPRLSLGMSVLKGMAISLPKFWVEPNDATPEIKEFVKAQIERFWTVSAHAMLESMDWGWAAGEVLYRYDYDDQLHFDYIQKFHAADVMPVTLEGDFAGIEVRAESNQFVGGQYAFWTVHDRDYNRWWGRSRYESAFVPWNEMYDRNGALDARRVYYFRHSFQGEVGRYPEGAHVDKNGVTQPNRDIMRALVENARSGGSYILPSTRDEHGNYLWSVEDRQTTNTSHDVREYIEDLRLECTEGIGLSTEVLQAAETGSGYSGRKVPEQAVRGILSQIVFWLIHDFDELVIKPLVEINFGRESNHSVLPFGLTDEPSGEPVAPEGQSVPMAAMDAFERNPNMRVA